MPSFKKRVNDFLDRTVGYRIQRSPNAIGWRQDGPGAYDAYPRESLAHRAFYNVGAGDFYHPHWTNIDFSNQAYGFAQKRTFLEHDLMSRDPLPVESDSAELVYCSHVLEHISEDSARALFAEVRRVLKPGGGFRITSPDAPAMVEAYKRGDTEYWERILESDGASLEQKLVLIVASELSPLVGPGDPRSTCDDADVKRIVGEMSVQDALDHLTGRCTFNPENPQHMSWWSARKTIGMLDEAGFAERYVSGYGQSRFAPMRNTALFDAGYPHLSFYVEAVR
jgi:SAM-dependent methyltransferase